MGARKIPGRIFKTKKRIARVEGEESYRNR